MNGSTEHHARKSSAGEFEPKVIPGSSSSLFWLLGLVGILAVWGDNHLINSGGDFHRQVYTPFESLAQVEALRPKSADDALAAKGRALYSTFCQPCHQPNGSGVPNQFPPLASSDWVNSAGPNRLIRIVLNGLTGPISVNGVQFNNAMPGFKDSVSDEDVAAILTYVRSNKEWNNGGAPVTVGQVGAVRKIVGDRADQWTADEILKIPDAD